MTSDLQMQQKVIIELITQMLLLPPNPVHSQGESGNNWVIQAVQQLLIRALAEEAPPRGLGVHKHFISPLAFPEQAGPSSFPRQGAGWCLFTAAAAASFCI